MAYVAYNNIRAFLSTGNDIDTATGNDSVLYATNFSATVNPQLKRVRRIGEELDYYIQTGPKSSSISVTAIPVTGAGFNQFTSFLALTGDFVSGSFIRAMPYLWRKCYLKSMNFSIEPWKPMLLNMEFDSLGQSLGVAQLDSYPEQNLDTGIISPLRGMSISLNNYTWPDQVTQYESLNFSIEVERRPDWEIGNAFGTSRVGKITKTLQINGISNWIQGLDYLPSETFNCTLTMADGNSFSVAGVLNSQNLSVDANGVAKGGLQIVEEMI